MLPSLLWSLLKCSSRDLFSLVSTPLTEWGACPVCRPSLLRTVKAVSERMKRKTAANGCLVVFFSSCSRPLTVEVKVIALVSVRRWRRPGGYDPLASACITLHSSFPLCLRIIVPFGFGFFVVVVFFYNEDQQMALAPAGKSRRRA